MSIKVAINGYTALGKRIADAIDLQDDMEVIGVSKKVPDFEAELLLIKEFPLFVPRELESDFEDMGFVVEGDIDDLVDACDIVIDTLPEEYSGANLELYRTYRKKAVFQGGPREACQKVFNSWANYESAVLEPVMRVPNPDVTGLCRCLIPLEDRIGLSGASATILRGMRTLEGTGDPHYSLSPDIDHHYSLTPDLNMLIPGVNFQVQAVEVPFSRLDLHSVMVDLKTQTTDEDLKDIFEKSFRIRMVSAETGLDTLHQVEVMAQDLGRSRSDLYENVIWDDGVRVSGKSACFFQALGLANVVPENIDCIRSMLNICEDKIESIGKTDRNLSVDL